MRSFLDFFALPVFCSEKSVTASIALFVLCSPTYTKAYAVELIKQMKKEKTARSADDWPWLRIPPTPSEPLMTGSFEKIVRARPADSVHVLVGVLSDQRLLVEV